MKKLMFIGSLLTVLCLFSFTNKNSSAVSKKALWTSHFYAQGGYEQLGAFTLNYNSTDLVSVSYVTIAAILLDNNGIVYVVTGIEDASKNFRSLDQLQTWAAQGVSNGDNLNVFGDIV